MGKVAKVAQGMNSIRINHLSDLARDLANRVQGGGWIAGGWGDGWHEHAAFDDALRDAETRAAKAEERSSNG